MDIKFEIQPVFKIDFFKIKSINFENKRNEIEAVLSEYPERPLDTCKSHRYKAKINDKLLKIFADEFNLIRARFNSKIILNRAWSITYDKGDYHVPHNHSSHGYAGIIYLRMGKKSPATTYIQPWNNERDQSVLYTPPVEAGDIMIVPQFLMHYTTPNKTYIKKRILSFDFNVESDL